VSRHDATRIYLRPDYAEDSQRDGRDDKAVLVCTGNRLQDAHEVAIICPCCGHAAAIIAQPPGGGSGSPEGVWVETRGRTVLFVRERPNDPTSYREVKPDGTLVPVSPRPWHGHKPGR
jgi:hypothetical protein